jgi:O-glycosyl hydrolase
MKATRSHPLGICRIVVAVCLMAGTVVSTMAETVNIDPDTKAGATVRYFGWDLKGWRSVADTPEKARTLYAGTRANLVRIPIFAQAHSADGSVDRTAYEAMLTCMRNIREVNPEVKIFAGLKLKNEDTFPDWVGSDEAGKIFGKTVKKPDPARYARLVADYIGFLRDEGFAIDYLGLGNEVNSALTVDRHIDTARLLRQELERRGYEEKFLGFKQIAPDSFGLGGANRFAAEIVAAGALDTVDIFGSHFYPDKNSGNLDQWRTLAETAPLPLWHTELHMRRSEDETNVTKIRDALAVVFATNKAGVEGYVWWGRGINDQGMDDLVKRKVINTILGGHAVETSGAYFAKGNKPREPLYQAFRVDDEVTLWLCNSGAARRDLRVNLEGRKPGKITSGFWTGPNTITAESVGQLTIHADPDAAGFTIAEVPENSLATVTFTLSPD